MKMDIELPLLLSTTDKYAKQMHALMQENRELRNRVTQDKMFNECKNRLREHGMSEDEAHRYIIKRAMDEKQNKYVMAQKIFQELCDGSLQV
jgi:AmiR/NasT family two-component response regulator